MFEVNVLVDTEDPKGVLAEVRWLLKGNSMERSDNIWIEATVRQLYRYQLML